MANSVGSEWFLPLHNRTVYSCQTCKKKDRRRGHDADRSRQTSDVGPYSRTFVCESVVFVTGGKAIFDEIEDVNTITFANRPNKRAQDKRRTKK